MKIGIPRALLYYKQGPLWLEFFRNLRAEIIVSNDTDISLLNEGSLLAPSESCMPVKIFFGHVKELVNKVDYVFIPRVVSVEGTAYTCPKFLGLPDMIEACEDMPPVLTATFDYRNDRKNFYRSVISLGQKFTKNPLKIIKAYKSGMRVLRKHEHLLYRKTLKQGGLKVAVVGHPYNIYDKFASLNVIERLEKQGISVITQENLQRGDLLKALEGLPKKLFWTYEKEVVGGAFYFMDSTEVDGVVYMLSFACGPDSLMQKIIEQKAKNNLRVPLLTLVVDEHSSETGLLTRVEAFIDMLERKPK
jgi:predicted nucleotide-binding protein (sugar kinase/HSP70/actin superfamily)